MKKGLQYKKELIRSMNYLAKNQKTIFIGQSVEFSGNAIFNTLKQINKKRKLNYQFLKRFKWEFPLV